MEMNDRIRQGRLKLGVSQEYIAEQLGVSRQAVSKWESGRSAPDTANLIALAGLLQVSVEWLAAGDTKTEPVALAAQEEKTVVFEPTPHGQTEAKRRNLTYKQKLGVFFGLLFLLAAALLLTMHLAPVDWDAGACGGGFVTYVFDKYSPYLTDLYRVHTERGYEFEAVRGTHTVTWSGRVIHVEVDIRYKDNERGVVTDRVHFRGKRIWSENYRWQIAAVAQQMVEDYSQSS